MAAPAPAYSSAPAYVGTLNLNAVSSRGEERLLKLWQDLENSEYWRVLLLLDSAQEQLRKLVGLSANWDSYGADPPNEEARRTAERVLAILELVSFPPTRIVASAEGGVAICFVRDDRYADVECLNDGEILAVTYRGAAEPYAWEVAPTDAALQAATEQIRAHFSNP